MALRLGESAAGHTFIRLLELVPLPFDSLCIPVDLSSDFRRDRLPSQVAKCLRPACSPVADCHGVARLAGVLKVFGEFLVLLEVGTGGKGSASDVRISCPGASC